MISTRSILGYWRLENNGLDEKGLNNLVAQGAVVYDDCKFGRGAVFNGVGSRLLNTSPTAILKPTSTVFVSAWIRPEAFNTAGSAVSGTTQGYNLFYPAGANVRYLIYTGSFGSVDIAQSAINLNVWQHHCMVYNGATIKVYIDGILRGTTSKTGNISYNTAAFAIGNYYSGALYFKGSIDEVVVGNVDLNIGEVKRLMSGLHLLR